MGRHRLLNLASAVSLVLCVATAVLWACCPLIASHRQHVVKQWPDGSTWMLGFSPWGSVRFSKSYPTLPADVRARIRPMPPALFAQASDSSFPVPGLNLARQRLPETLPDGRIRWHPFVSSVTVHCRWPLLLAAVLPGWQLWRWADRRRRRRVAARGLCPACGYDLRATPEPGGARLDRCPECGAVAAAAE